MYLCIACKGHLSMKSTGLASHLVSGWKISHNEYTPAEWWIPPTPTPALRPPQASADKGLSQVHFSATPEGTQWMLGGQPCGHFEGAMCVPHICPCMTLAPALLPRLRQKYMPKTSFRFFALASHHLTNSWFLIRLWICTSSSEHLKDFFFFFFSNLSPWIRMCYFCVLFPALDRSLLVLPCGQVTSRG